MLDDRGAHGQRVLDIQRQLERDVVAAAQFDDPRNAHEVDPVLEAEAADDRRAREDENRDGLVGLDQCVGDLAAAPEMPKAEGIVAVDQDALGPPRRSCELAHSLRPARD